MDPNNYFSAFLPQQYQQQQIPIEHLISSSHQQFQQQQQQQQYSQIFNNNLFAAALTNNVMPTLTPISAASSTPAGYIPPSAAAAAAVGPTSSSSSFLYNNNNFGGSLSLSNNTSSSFPLQQSATLSNLAFQHSISSQQPQQPFVQISLSPSIPQPIAVIIDGQQYLEFPSTNPAEQSQYIPLQLFLQPQTYFTQSSEIYQPISTPASNLPPPLQSSITFQSPPSSTQQIVSNQKQKSLANSKKSFVKMDATAINESGGGGACTAKTSSPGISPPTKKKKRSSNENFNNRLPKNQSSLHHFFPTSSQAPSTSFSSNMGQQNGRVNQENDDDDDDILVVSETITNFGPAPDSDCVIIEPKKPSAAKASRSAAIPKSTDKTTDSAGKKVAENSVPVFPTSNTQSVDKPFSAVKALLKSPSASVNQPSSSASIPGNNLFQNKPASSATNASDLSTNVSARAPSTSSANPLPAATPSVSVASNFSDSSTSSDSQTTTASNAVNLNTTESPEPPDPLEFRLQTASALNSRVSPTFDYKMATEIIKEIVPIILEVIPNAIINGIGPAYHECGSFVNHAFDEETQEIAYIWSFFSLSVMIGDKKTKELQIPDDPVLEMWIQEIEKKFHDANIVENSLTRMQRGARKLIFEHKRIDAKVTLLFCAEDACKRSQIIRLYTRFYTRIIQVAYLYNNLIVSIPALHLLTNTPICYMIIYFLQQTDRIAVLHQSPASVLIDKINLIQPPDYRTEDIQHLISPNPKYSHNSVAFLTYEFAKFYSNFDYDKIIIDISQKERRFWSKYDAENKKPIAVRCCFSGRNLAGQVSAHCLSTFQKKMKEVVESFKENKEATVFPSDLENFRSQR